MKPLALLVTLMSSIALADNVGHDVMHIRDPHGVFSDEWIQDFAHRLEMGDDGNKFTGYKLKGLFAHNNTKDHADTLAFFNASSEARDITTRDLINPGSFSNAVSDMAQGPAPGKCDKVYCYDKKSAWTFQSHPERQQLSKMECELASRGASAGGIYIIGFVITTAGCYQLDEFIQKTTCNFVAGLAAVATGFGIGEFAASQCKDHMEDIRKHCHPYGGEKVCANQNGHEFRYREAVSHDLGGHELCDDKKPGHKCKYKKCHNTCGAIHDPYYG